MPVPEGISRDSIRAVVELLDGGSGSTAAQGAVDDEAYADNTGAADGTVISLLKGIYVQLTIIAANTAA